MKKRFLKFVVLLTFIAIFLFAGCTCNSCGCSSCGTEYTYTETFGAASGCGCGAGYASKDRGTTEQLSAKFIKGDFSLTCHKDPSGWVKSFSYTVEVTGFSGDFVYGGCVVVVKVEYSAIGASGENIRYSTVRVELNARGAGKKSVTETIECNDVAVRDVHYSYEGIVTHL